MSDRSSRLFSFCSEKSPGTSVSGSSSVWSASAAALSNSAKSSSTSGLASVCGTAGSVTSSGSGPVNALVQREVAIGLGMTSQGVVEINDGVNLDIVFFEEGSPYSMYGNAVLAKSAGRQAVMDVFNYVATDLCKGDNEKYFPDQIYKDFIPVVEGFPTGIKYGNMANDTLSEKERLQAKWDH